MKSKLCASLKIVFLVILGFLMFNTPVQACKTGICYENGISTNSYWECPCGSSGSRPCYWSTYWDRCQGHNPVPADGLTEYRTATCTQDGVVNLYVKCTHCDEPHLYSNTPTSASAHSWSDIYSVAGDSTYHYWDCQNSWHDTSVDGADPYPEEHDWSGSAEKKYDATYDYVYSSPTCTTAGIKMKYWSVEGIKCSDCGYVYTASNSGYDTEEIPALGHSMSTYSKSSNTYHIATCTRSGCTHSHKEKHTACDWINSGKGYKYKNCVGSTTDCSCDYCDLDDTNGCGATEIQIQWYNLNLTLNGNGGTVGGKSSNTRNVTYGTNTTLPVASRVGYTFKGWGYSKDTYGVSYNGAQSVASQTINSALANGDCSATLYAQWEKTINYNISYLNSDGTQTKQSFAVVFRNNATSATVSSFTNGTTYYTDSTSGNVFTGLTSISSFKDGTKVTKNGYSDWVERGIAKGTASTATTISSTLSVSTSEVYASNGTINYYASYQRKPVITLVDYATNEMKTRTITGSVTIGGVAYDTAGMCYNGTVDRKPVFTLSNENTMVYGEKLASGAVKNETWTAQGWSLDKIASAKKYASTNISMGTKYIAQQAKLASYGDYTYYGNYAKTVTLACDPNGGFIKQQISTYSRSANSTISYTRYANINSSTPTTTNKTFTLAKASYLGENGYDKYAQGAWVYGSGQINTDFYGEIVGTNKNNTSGEFRFTPLVSETVYASWTNQTAQTSYEPEVIVTKKAEWANPSGDDSSVDFDAEKDIDIDGIVKVTLTVNVDNKSGSGLVRLNVLDYYDAEVWEFVNNSKYKYSCSRGGIVGGIYGDKAGSPVWEITTGNEKLTGDGTYTCTYYLKLKEKYWTVTPDGKEVIDETAYYINPIENLTKYQATIKSDGTFDYSSDYYSTTEGQKAYTYATYTIIYNGGTKLDGTQRYVPYSTSNAFVLMEHVHWKPTIGQVIIDSDTNNIYKDSSASYKNTYFVQYDTHSTNGSKNSLFNITINSSIIRSYSYYQITNNLFDIKTAGKVEQVYNNSIGINKASSTISKITTSNDLDTGYTAGTILNLSSAKNLHTKVNTNGFQYTYGALTSQNTMYATNQDGLKFSIYPFARVTCNDNGKIYETTRDTTTLKNQRLDLVIDASNPIITADSRIKTESSEYGEWTTSDGYVDINLVDSKTNPEAKTQTLAFKFEDKVSGVNDPRISSDWITAIKDNVQVTLVNVDSGKTVFDYSKDNYGSIIAVKYNTANGMNKKGTVSVILNPNNEDLLGHLKLTIKVIDNVGNWETKTYDIYSFCLTGNVNAVDTLPDSDERDEAEIWNGEQGKIQISANGWVDRVKVDFEYALVEASKKELTKRNNITGDEYKINGDYPLDDSNLTATKETVTYLPSKYLKCKWGYISGEIGGMPLSLAELATTEYTLNNSILNAHLNELIANYIANETGGYVENINGSNYAIYGTTLYTYPIYLGEEIKSYLDSYTLDGSVIMNETPYPVNVIINGSQYATINYTEKDSSYVASIEEQTVFTSNWVKVGDEYYKPLEHYFYMPVYAPERLGETENDYHIVQLTAYKDSDTDFIHSVSIQLTMTNKDNPGIRDLQTIIKDN